MNTKNFCEEFERIFGSFQLKHLKDKEKVISCERNFVSSPYSNFIYEVSLYLDARICDIKFVFEDEFKILFPLCEHVYHNFRKQFRRKCKGKKLATYITGENLQKCFTRYRYYP